MAQSVKAGPVLKLTVMLLYVASLAGAGSPLPAAYAQDGSMAPLSQGMTTYQIFDQQFNLVAGAYDIPAGWNAHSQVEWNIEHFSQPLQLHSEAVSPDGSTAVEFFPTEQFCWIVPHVMRQPGQQLTGGATLLPPVSAQEAMQHFEIPKLRGSISGLQIEQITPVPNLGAMLNIPTAPGSTQEGVCARISYQVNGQAMEEEIYGLKIAFSGVPSHSSVGTMVQYNWGFGRLFSFRAPQGQLDSQKSMFWKTVNSFRPNPAWQAVRAQVQQRALQHNNMRLQATANSIANANMLSRTVIAGQEAFFAQQAARREQEWVSDHQQIEARYATPDNGKISQTDAFGDMMMGRETYADGSKHSGYHDYMWGDGQGNYIPTNDANFNPNINADRNWGLIDKAK